MRNLQVQPAQRHSRLFKIQVTTAIRAEIKHFLCHHEAAILLQKNLFKYETIYIQ